MNKNEKTEISLEFDKIKVKWEECTLTDAARKAIADTRLILADTELAARLRETTQSRQMLEKCGTPPLVSMEGIRETVTEAEKGQCLTPEELERMALALVAVKRLKDYLERGKVYEIPLAYYAENLDSLEELTEQLRYQIWNGQVSDNASKLLKSLRGDILRAQDRMREKAESVMRANKECMSDQFSTIRNGHVCIPVKKEYKFKISGILIDKSSTGSTLFIEPAAAARYYDQLQELQIDEENEVRRILYELSSLVAESADTIRQDIGMMEKLDFIFSKGKLSVYYDGREPQIVGERKIYLRGARHPLMDKSICVPLDFSMGDGINGIVITGPNTGGKTVALKTVALSCLMAQCGLHIACEEAAICMNRNILCDIGDGQSLSENLSTFSAHIVNVLDILRKVTPESLVVMDELGSGTDPAEGMGIAVAILEELKKSGALFLVTTHYPEVKTYAEREKTIVNARMTFDRENLKPLYQMVIGEAGESCAFYIAGRLGMPASMLRRAAREAYGEGSMQERGFGEGTKGVIGGGTEETSGGGTEGVSGGGTEGASGSGAEGVSGGGTEGASGGGTEGVSGGGTEGVSGGGAEGVSGGGAEGALEDGTEGAASRKTEGSFGGGNKGVLDGRISGAHFTEQSNRTEWDFLPEKLEKENVPRLVRTKAKTVRRQGAAFRRGDSVMIYPDKKIGIVCEPANEKGILRVQLPGKKIWINHKRVKLQVAAQELYPEDYDFSIIFDTVENRKLRHQMERKFVDGEIVT